MTVRPLLLALAGIVVAAASAQAQLGTTFIEGRLGAMIPVGTFHHQQDPGIAYTVAGGYTVSDFVEVMAEFTQSFNDTDDFTKSGPDFFAFSDEVAQTFVLGAGPRIKFAPPDFPVRPYGVFTIGWYHFAHFNEIVIDGRKILSDADDDAFGLQAGLGVEGTILEIYEHPRDKHPLAELTFGALVSYHHAFDTPDEQFLTTMGSLGVRF